MDRFLYVGMSGARQLMLSQAVNANNLANASTAGFRADLQAFESATVRGPGLASRVNAVIGAAGVDFAPGPLQETGRALDVAVNGEGWIAVQAPDGAEVLTRAGEFSVGPGGILTMPDGSYVLGDAGPLAVPPDQRVFVEPDGSVVVQADDGGAGAVFGRLKLVNPPAESLRKREDGMIVSAAPLEADAAVRVRSGAIEQSNVNPVQEMVRMIELSRLWEMNVKTMSAAEENAREAASMVRLS